MLVPGPEHRVVGEFVPVQVELASDEIHDRRRNDLARSQQAARGAEVACVVVAVWLALVALQL